MATVGNAELLRACVAVGLTLICDIVFRRHWKHGRCCGSHLLRLNKNANAGAVKEAGLRTERRLERRLNKSLGLYAPLEERA